MDALKTKFNPFLNPLFVLIADALLLNGCILATFSVRFSFSIPKRNIEAYHNTWPYITAIHCLIFYLQGMYDYDENDDGLSVFFKVFSAISMGTIAVVALTFASRDFAFPRTVFLLSYIVLLAAFSVWRLIVQQQFLRTIPVRKVVLYGDAERMGQIEEFISHDPSKRFSFAGKIEAPHKDQLVRMFQAGEADCAIITDRIRAARTTAFDIFLIRPGAAVYLVPEIYDIVVGALHHTIIGDLPLIRLSEKTILGRLLLLKRATDFILSTFLLIASFPFLLIGMAATALSSRGPIFYSQERVGRGGKVFKIYKVRTMVADAEKLTGPMLSTKNDPRITPVGRILRATKIDELPQLLNVFLGQMSMVGPRPERPEFVNKFEQLYPAYSDRKKVLPGITGLAQINGLYESDPDVKLKYDLLYIYNYRPLLDVVVLYRTFQYVLRENLMRRTPPDEPNIP